MKSSYLVALAGNPNTGKSTVFNALTGLKQHTGNWPGKTVLLKRGTLRHQGNTYEIVDLPGTYSLSASSPEEEAAREFITLGDPDVVVVVVDATCLERNLHLTLQILQLTHQVVVCLNLMDEAEKLNLRLDPSRLEAELGVPVVPTAAVTGEGLQDLKDAIARTAQGQLTPQPNPVNTDEEQPTAALYRRAEEIAALVVGNPPEPGTGFTARLDNLVTSRAFGIPFMLVLLGGILWLTISGANYPSEILAKVFFKVEAYLDLLFTKLNFPTWLHGVLVLGMYRGLAWVVSVMLPPMAIFFSLFTLLEDLGLLPRIAFNLDPYFQRAGANGKQALTMAMGFGCNAAGVTAARIIDSPRERLVAILTNNFMPCNGRFPILIVMGTIAAGSVARPGAGFTPALIVLGAIVVSVLAALIASKLLTATILRGESSFFILELPPYRLPQVGVVVVRSFLDRTLAVLWRAVVVAAPCGALTWVLANVSVSGATLLAHLSSWLHPLGSAMGLDGVILLGFILGLPANEIIIPIIFMGYLSANSLMEVQGLAAIQEILTNHGWTWLTALNFMVFAIFHWPCATTLLTIKKETGSTKWTLLSALLPTAFGVILCVLLARIVKLWAV